LFFFINKKYIYLLAFFTVLFGQAKNNKTYFQSDKFVLGGFMNATDGGLDFEALANIESKYGVYGFYPTTNSLKETSDYVEKLINDKLPTTTRIIGCSWCLGVYPTFYICNEIGASDIFFFDVIVVNLIKTPNYYASFQSHEKIDILNGIKPRPQVSFDPDHLSVQCFVGGPETDQLTTRNNEQLEYIQYLNNVKVHRLSEEIFTYNNKSPFNTLELAMLKNTPIPQFKELLELNND